MLSFLVDFDFSLLPFLYWLCLHLISLSLDLDDIQVTTSPCLNHKEVFLGLGTIGIVHNQASRKARLHGCGCDHFKLMLSVWIKLEDCPLSNAQAVVKGLKELTTSLERIIIFATGHAKPLNSRHTDCPIKDSGSKLPALANIDLPKASLGLLRSSDIKHITADIYSFPKEIVLLESL